MAGNCKTCGRELIGYKRCPICQRERRLWKKEPVLMAEAQEKRRKNE